MLFSELQFDKTFGCSCIYSNLDLLTYQTPPFARQHGEKMLSLQGQSRQKSSDCLYKDQILLYVFSQMAGSLSTIHNYEADEDQVCTAPKSGSDCHQWH